MANEVAPQKKKGVDWSTIDTQFQFEGKKIILPGEPENMDYDAAIAVIKRQRDSENQRYDVNEMVLGAPWDALTAISKAMKDIYGVVIAQSMQTFFGEIKPDLITINIGPEPDENIQVAAGQMSLPNITAPVLIGLHRTGAFIRGEVRRRDRAILVEIANRAREIMRTDSIYKGKAIRLKVDDEGNLQTTVQPEFIQLKHVRETDMIHTPETSALIQTNIFSPLRHTDACRRHKIPLKRGILLSGRYGTGKSLTARVTAKVAVDNGWTFIMLDKAQGLASAIEFARTYQPCVIFAEDIDRAGADRDNDEAVNDLVNLLDGLITKDMEMEVVLTTNFIDRIDRALLRPGRFDAVITIQPPDGETAIRLIRQYARNLVSNSEDLSKVGEVIAGQIPATIREVVERAKLTMLMEERERLTADDLYFAAKGMTEHMALLEDKKPESSPAERFYTALSEIIGSAAGFDTQVTDDLSSNIHGVRRSQHALAREVRDRLDQTNMFAKAAASSADAAKDIARETNKTAQADLAATNKVLKAVTS